MNTTDQTSESNGTGQPDDGEPSSRDQYAHDDQLNKLQALRDAAEANKQSSLSHLVRKDMTAQIIGATSGLRGVMERVEQVCRTDVPVLILGETGSGKEVVARAIHERSHRATGPFLRINCGAIPTELVDSELFGHEKGSFTGAHTQRQGWFERADGGTLFLDEIGELSPAAQVRLLRVLQDGTFERVGGDKQVSVDVRVIAATHRDLESMVAEGTFRQDLWYRISVFPIRLPPLRDRLEDVPAMAAHFAARSAQRLGGLPPDLTAEDLRLLTAYPWPGNVRELAAVIERAVILGDAKHLELAKALGPLPETTKAHYVRIDLPQSEPRVRYESADGKFMSLDEAMAAHIAAALHRTRGRIEGPNGAAQLLQINPHTLRGRMRALGLDWRQFRASADPTRKAAS